MLGGGCNREAFESSIGNCSAPSLQMHPAISAAALNPAAFAAVVLGPLRTGVANAMERSCLPTNYHLIMALLFLKQVSATSYLGVEIWGKAKRALKLPISFEPVEG